MSNKIERLARSYERFCALPWEQSLAGAQRVWFAVYDKTDERRLRAHLGEFDIATTRALHTWHAVDLTNSFGRWMAENEYHESYFERPSDLNLLLPEFEQSVAAEILNVLKGPADEKSVVAVYGVACLFGLAKISNIVKHVAPLIRGRLLVFFPGEYENNNYRLLDARDGWNYHAIPLSANDPSEG